MNRTTSAADRQVAAQKKKVIVLLVLVGVLGLVWIINFLKGKPQAAVASSPSPAVATTVTPIPSAAVQTTGKTVTEVEVDWPAVSMRDPFVFDDQHYQKKAVKTRTLKHLFELQGTILGDHPRALINGQTFRIGDQIDEAIITGIGHGQVTVIVDGVELRVGQN